MSIETALEKLADAILAHAKALTAMGATPVATTTGAGDAAASDPKDIPDRVVYWQHEDGKYGECTIAEFRKMKKGDEDSYTLLDIDAYKALCQAAKKKELDNKKAAEKADKVKADAAAKKAAEAKAKADAESDEITDEDLGGLIKPFAGVEDPKERKRRVEWLKAVFSRFGVPKASELMQSQRPEFVELVKKAVAATEDDEGAELPDVESGDNDLV